jgi:ADP-ribose pyrophosphatase YjhB (NUDIX family)
MEDKKTIVKVRAIILHEGKLLVVRHPHDLSFAALPGGKLEWSEDLKECMSREIIEELGVKPDIGRLLYVNTFTQTDNKHYLEFFFEIKNGVEYFNTAHLAGSHAHEIAEIAWVSPIDDIHIKPKNLAEDFKVGEMISDEVRYIQD